MSKNTKIVWKNIYYMLCYCVDELRHFKNGFIDIEDIKGTNELLAHLLIKSFEVLYRNGYVKNYRRETIVTDKPHGRIDLAKSVSTGKYLQGKLVCRIDIMDINHKINQIIKSAFTVLIQSNSKIDDKIDENLISKLYYYRNMLRGVDDIVVTNQLLNSIVDIPEWYKPIFAVCKMILSDWIALDKEGKTRLLELNNNKRLCYIWEKFLRAFIKKEYKNYIVEKRTLHTTTGKTRTPDIEIIDDIHKKILILDAKWYGKEKETTANANELYMNCSIAQNEDNYGSNYVVTGLNLYASTNKCVILPPDKTENNNILYSDSFISVNVNIIELEEQIKWVVEQGFNLTETRDNIYKEH